MNRAALCSACQGTISQHSGECSEMTREQRESLVRFWMRRVAELEQDLNDARNQQRRAEAHASKLD